MAVTASNGGLIPWQAGWATRFGRFQFVLGRELGATFYGYGFDNTMTVPGATPGADARVVDFKSILFDLPILEYRPYRAFDTKQSSAVLIQLYAAADVPQEHDGDLPAGRARREARDDLLDRAAADLRLAALLLIAGRPPGAAAARFTSPPAPAARAASTPHRLRPTRAAWAPPGTSARWAAPWPPARRAPPGRVAAPAGARCLR